MKENLFRYRSPVGLLECSFLGSALTGVSIGRETKGPSSGPGQSREMRSTPATRRLKSQLDAYFAGSAASFDLCVSFAEGTEFEREVWLALREIPRGEVRSYQWLAGRLGRPNAARAVGQALGRNPLPVILPCHRVVRSDGSLGGFSCGLDVKRKLLELEGLSFVNSGRAPRGSRGRHPS